MSNQLFKELNYMLRNQFLQPIFNSDLYYLDKQ